MQQHGPASRPCAAVAALCKRSIHSCGLVAFMRGLWQHPDMIKFRTLADDHPDLAHSPLLRGALLTLQYTHTHGSIGLTRNMAFKRVFVHWAVENFDWPGKSAEEMFR